MKETDDPDTPESKQNAGTDSITIRHETTPYEELGLTVVEAVATATDRAKTDLPPLHRAIDPDALERVLTRGESSSVTVAFDYADTGVEVSANGTIQVQIDEDE